MTYEADVKKMNELLKMTNPKVVKNVTIVTPDDLGSRYLLHLARMKFDELIPNVSKKAAPSEDNTMIRIHTSPYLIGCIRGYAAVMDELLKLPSKNKFSFFLGGYYLYAIPFKVALRPNKRLVYDADYSDEIWLTTYDESTISYKPESRLEIIYTEVSGVPGNKWIKHRVKFLIKNNSDIEIRLTPELKIGKGCYSFVHEILAYEKSENDSIVELTKIDSSLFEEAKKTSAEMLSR